MLLLIRHNGAIASDFSFLGGKKWDSVVLQAMVYRFDGNCTCHDNVW